MKKSPLILIAATAAIAALPAGYSHWTEQQIAEKSKGLPAKMSKVKVSTESLGAWGNHSMSLIHREGSGEAELHETQADILIVRSGEGSLIIGGTMPGAHKTTPNELRAPKLEGGETQPLKPGDVLHVAPKTPHQVILEPGGKIDYYAIKVDQK